MSSNEDKARTDELKTKIFGHVAERLFSGDKNPYTITPQEIESHKGRIDKTLRLLSEYITYAGKKTEKTSWGSTHETVMYKVEHFEEESAAYAKAPEFMSTWDKLHDDIYGYGASVSDQESFDLVGYRGVSSLGAAQILYVYWHQDEYDFATTKRKIPYVYPRALARTRTIAMLRAIVEQEHQDGFQTKLERYLGLTNESLKRDDKFKFEVRNFCARAADLTEERYFGKNGFRDEYAHYHDYFEALLLSLKRLDDQIKTKGGQAAVTREMRQATMTELLEESPLRINWERLSDKHYDADDTDRMLKRYASVFILRHSDLFTYDTIYGADESITYIDDKRAVKYEHMRDEHSFEPNAEEILVIESSKKEYVECSAKMISRILQTT